MICEQSLFFIALISATNFPAKRVCPTFSLRGAETAGEAGCWSVPLEAFVGRLSV